MRKEKKEEKKKKIAENRENVRKFHKILVLYMAIFQKLFSTRNLKKF